MGIANPLTTRWASEVVEMPGTGTHYGALQSCLVLCLSAEGVTMRVFAVHGLPAEVGALPDLVDRPRFMANMARDRLGLNFFPARCMVPISQRLDPERFGLRILRTRVGQQLYSACGGMSDQSNAQVSMTHKNVSEFRESYPSP